MKEECCTPQFLVLNERMFFHMNAFFLHFSTEIFKIGQGRRAKFIQFPPFATTAHYS